MTPIEAQAAATELQQMIDTGHEDEAAARCRQLLADHPDDINALNLAGPFFAAVGYYDEARQAFERLLELNPRDSRPLMQLSSMCQQAEDLAGAEQAADRLLAVAPEHPAAIGLKADVMFLTGRYRETFEYLAPKARSRDAHAGIIVNFARVCRVEKKSWEGISALERALASPEIHPVLAADANFQLAALYDSVDRRDQAWEALTRANAAKGAKFDPDDFDRRAEAMMQAWTPESVATLPHVEPSELPILIVGMPRSGTTLAEQILASHPLVAAAGELPDLARAVIRLRGGMEAEPPLLDSPDLVNPEAAPCERARYLAHLQKLADAAGPETPRVTDKMPLNALHLGLVRAITPRARVIWCRRDPLDTCISCYFQHFGGSNPFTYDLAHLGRFHNTLERVMRHWQEVLGLEILELPYEALVADQEGWTHRILEFCALPWDDQCLRYYESDRVARTLSNDQVRQPVYSRSIARWKRYEEHLASLREVLGL